MIQQYVACYNAAVTLAEQSAPSPFFNGGQSAETGAENYIETLGKQIVSDVSEVAGTALDVLDAVSTIRNVADAYNKCAG